MKVLKGKHFIGETLKYFIIPPNNKTKKWQIKAFRLSSDMRYPLLEEEFLTENEAEEYCQNKIKEEKEDKIKSEQNNKDYKEASKRKMKQICIFCNKEFPIEIEYQLDYIIEGCSSCGSGQEATISYKIYCPFCKRLIYQKDGIKID